MLLRDIHLRFQKEKKWVLVGTTNSTSLKTNYAVSNGKKVKLTANTEYQFRVRAYYSATVDGVETTKYGEYSTIIAVTKISSPRFSES
ncbi:MAG: fibronectin type III domain-containing protein [Clostridiales bacterium]|nr:fibronectin type III domain-containing protein [Clostridiales bacterium]